MSRDDIMAVQRLLRALGRDVAVDGIYGAETRAAVSEALRAAAGASDIDPRAVALVREFESFQPIAYLDDANVWTIGYGTTAAAGVGITPKLGMRITEAEAEEYLRRGLDKFAALIRPKITRPTTPAEFGAMLSLAYNIGPTAFARSSVLRWFNGGDKDEAADAFRLWNRAGGRVLKGLVRRREAERDLFLSTN